MFWCGTEGIGAQELQAQRSPYSAYLDLRPSTATGEWTQAVPDWIEAFEFLPGNGTGSAPAAGSSTSNPEKLPATGDGTSGRARSVFRIRLQRPPGASDDLQLRVFFEDRTLATRPTVTAWDELGTELMRSLPLGQGLGIATSETLTIPMAGVNYLEIETSDDGTQVRGAFFGWLEKAQIRQPIDFPSLAKVTEPFQVISSTRTRRDDTYLYGVVTASLQKAPMTMTAAFPAASIQFDLERQPLVAVVSYEVLGASVNHPPVLQANNQTVGAIDLMLPDLADPGYQGLTGDGGPDLPFRYTGWMRAQKIIPGCLLVAGLNELKLTLSNGSNPAAIRSVEIQLKYNWEKLDYVLAPASIPSAPH